ncbi:MAG: molybdopterin molybdenumtransferase MoeA [Sphingobacteriales bacterium]|nr:MAG: molybdopterin molybdenumtransferase MoeA [Sphingobacteriales bacterium]
MLTLSEAQQTLWQQASAIPDCCEVPLAHALGCVAARAVIAHVAVPPADNSAMDGYALRHAEALAPLPVSARVVAGLAPEPLAPGSAARIFTGGEIPVGADTVVMQEHTQVDPDGRVVITQLPKLGANIRPQGQDVAPGQCLVSVGQRLGPVDLALLASQGITHVEVVRRCKVALVTTGSELVAPGQPLAAGQIYNSNCTLIGSALQLLNVEVFNYNLVDDQILTQQLLAQLASSVDIIITTGGVSAGEEDHVKTSLASLGQVSFWKIAIKPGKPFMFGRIGDTPVLGLPGNPVSSFITYILLAKPFIQACQGGTAQLPAARFVPAAEDLACGGREEFIRVENTATGVRPLLNQSSGVLRSLQLADGIIRLAAHQSVKAGEPVEFWTIDELLAP